LLAAGKLDEAWRVLRTPTGTWSLNDLREMTARAEVAVAREDWKDAAAIAAEARKQIAAVSGRDYLKDDEARLALLQGRAYLGLHRAADALPLLSKAVELRTEILDAQSPSLGEALLWLAQCRATLGNPDEAEKLRYRARRIYATHQRLGEQYLAANGGISRELRE
jgi:tetratricopeptide (TPR) repeat protein